MLLFTQAMFAQSDAGAGGLRGEISNADGTAAANAAITVRNAETGYVRELHTDILSRLPKANSRLMK